MWMKMKLEQATADEIAAQAVGGPAPEAPVEEKTGIDTAPQSDEEATLMADLFDDSNEEEIVEVQNDAPAPQEQPAAVAEPEPAPVAQEVVQPPQEAPVVPEAPAVEAPAAPETNFEETRNAALAELEKRYALSKEDADAMISEPETVLPKLASRMYMDIFESVLNAVQTTLPQAISHISQREQAMQRDENDFYDKWPMLRDEKYKQQVLRIGQMYRQMNPTASKEQFIQDVGLQSAIALRLPLPGYAAPQPGPAQPAPYQPPRAGAVAPAAPNATPTNQFAALAEEWESEN